MIRIIDAIADFVQTAEFDELPDPVVDTVVDAITDALGVGLAGSQEPIAGAIRKALGISVADDADIRSGPQQQAPALIGFAGSCPSDTAALYNGSVIHALDFDDTNHPAYAHPSSHLVPVILEAHSREGVDGRRAITAYTLGLEIEARLGATMNMAHYLRGWHTTGTFGALAATTTAAYLYRLDTAQTRTALAIAASMASGIRANFGTMTKPLHAGLAARNAVQAVNLARSGFTASDDALDGPLGFVETYSGLSREDHAGGMADSTNLRDSWASLGQDWLTISPYGLALKPYPSCGATHPAIEAAILAREEVGAEAIDRVIVETTENSSRILIYSHPATGLEGKFSMQFCVAAALERGYVDLSTFSDASVRQGSTQALVDSVSVGVHPELRDNTEFAAEVTVVTASGTSVRRRVELAKGKRERWMTTEELREKFRSCAEPVLGSDGAIEAFRLAQALRTLASLDPLRWALAPASAV